MSQRPLGRFVDLYELTMAQSYLEHGVTGEAVFDLHVRSLPPDRGYLIAAGAARLAKRLERFRFEDEDLERVRSHGLSEELVEYLDGFRFDGEVRVVPEGRPVFPYEPIVQVRGPLPMAQLVETLVLNTVHLETVLASKAARCFEAVDGCKDPDGMPAIVDFGARRAHGLDAARAAARCAYLAGFTGTSLVDAADAFSIPCFGTMAHAYVEAFDTEHDALAAFARSFPDGTTLLIDTFDTVEGARLVVDLARELASEEVEIGGVRLDSGDLGELARQVRAILDEAGLGSIEIFASGGLDEHALADLHGSAPIDGYGVGTSLVVSDDAPSLDISYKLAAYEGDPVLKTSTGKRTLPGAKQVHREVDEDGTLSGDTIALADEGNLPGEPIVQPLRSMDPVRALAKARERFIEEVATLPAEVRRLEAPATYPVVESPGIDDAVQTALNRVEPGPG